MGLLGGIPPTHLFSRKRKEAREVDNPAQTLPPIPMKGCQ